MCRQRMSSWIEAHSHSLTPGCNAGATPPPSGAEPNSCSATPQGKSGGGCAGTPRLHSQTRKMHVLLLEWTLALLKASTEVSVEMMMGSAQLAGLGAASGTYSGSRVAMSWHTPGAVLAAATC